MDDPTRAPLPHSNPAPPVPDSIRPTDLDDDEELTHLPPEYRAAVRRLQAQVERAATALNRLRAENERLRHRVEELEQRPALQPNTTTFVLDDEPDALRNRISTFIDAVDAYLEDGTSDGTSAPTDAGPPAAGGSS
jgi:hypothetical protein